MKKILVTGADGFIGSHLVELLVKEGYSVKAFAQYNSFNNWGWLDDIERDILNSIEVMCGDIRDPFFVKHSMEGCDAVINLAALIAIPFSYVAPQSYVETNVTGAINVVEAAKTLNISKVIQTSTSEVYGSAMFVPITEDHPLQGQSPYSASKIAADQMALSYFSSFKTPVSIVRPFNTYGPRQSARAVIPTIISQIASGQTKIKLGSVSPTRDFNYVEDTALGFLAALKSDQSVGEVINIGSGFEISVGDTVELIAKLMNKDIEIISDDIRLRPENSEVERLCACNKKAKDLLNWEPSIKGQEGLAAGLSKTIEWFSNPSNLKKYKTDIYNI
jgi:NAD dependent epimerase/dehydratase